MNFNFGQQRNPDRDIAHLTFDVNAKTSSDKPLVSSNFTFGLDSFHKSKELSLKGNSGLELDLSLQGIEFFRKAPCDFEICTNNGSYHFNKEFLIDASETIQQECNKLTNPKRYVLDFDDPSNAMSKIEALFKGERIVFSKIEKKIYRNITKLLKFRRFPSFNCHSFGMHSSSSVTKELSLQLSNNSLKFISIMKQKFLIRTHKNTYKCNNFGIRASEVLFKLVSDDPTMNEFEYEFEDEFGDFSIISKFFNGETITITTSNMELIMKIATDLQIEKLIKPTSDYIENYENRMKTFETNYFFLEPVDNIFELLFNLKPETIEKTKDIIMRSDWPKEEANVQEMVAIFLKVIKTKMSLHRDIAELANSISKSANPTNHLHIFIPFMNKNLLNVLKKKNSYCSFAIQLLKIGLIDEKSIVKKFEFQKKGGRSVTQGTSFETTALHHREIMNDSRHRSDNNTELWFLPEIQKADETNFENLLNISNLANELAKVHMVDNWSQYKNQRDLNEPDTNLARAIRHDDIEAFQAIISQSGIDLNSKVEYCLFDQIPELYLINYAAFHSSIKCFKFLLLNHAKIYQSTFSYAVGGGNAEIIRITEENSSNISEQDNSNPENISKIRCCFERPDSAIQIAIKNHNYDLFNWILEQKYLSKQTTGNNLFPIVSTACRECYTKAIFECVINGFDFQQLIDVQKTKLIQTAAVRGYSKLCQLLLMFNNKQPSTIGEPRASFSGVPDISVESGPVCVSAPCGRLRTGCVFGPDGVFGPGGVFDTSSGFGTSSGFDTSGGFVISGGFDTSGGFVISGGFGTSFHCGNLSFLEDITVFGSLSLFKMFFDSMSSDITQGSIQRPLIKAAEKGNLDIFIFILNWKNFKYNDRILEQAVNASLLNDFNDIPKYLIENNYYCPNNISELNSAIVRSNVEMTKFITDKILSVNPMRDFTSPFITASQNTSDEICQYFAEKHVVLDFEEIGRSIRNLTIQNPKILLLLIRISDPKENESLMTSSLNNSIESQNKEVIEFALKYIDSPPINSLFLAVKIGRLDIIKMIVKKNNKPSFINAISSEGTALAIAVKCKFVDVVEYFLSLPDINPDRFENNQNTPLILATQNTDLDTVNVILKFYGDRIQSQIWQVSAALRNLIPIFFKIRKKNKKLNNNNNFVNKNNNPNTGASFAPPNKDPNSFRKRPLGCNTNVEFNIRKNAAYDEIVAIINRFLSIDSINNVIKEFGCPILELAIEINDKEMVQKIISLCGDDLINQSFSRDGNSPLITAISCENTEIAKFLLGFPNIDVNHRNFQQFTPLIFAVEKGSHEIIAMITSNPKFDPKESRVSYVFHSLAEFNGQEEIVRYLLSLKGSDVNFCVKENGKYQTPLTKAVDNDNEMIARIIIENESFDPIKSLAQTALFAATKNETINIFEMLIKFQEDGINSKNEFGCSLLKKAVTNDSLLVVSKILSDEKFDPVKSDIRSSFAASYNNLQMMQMLFNTNLIDLNTLLPNGQTFTTSLDYKNGNIDSLLFLIENGADVNLANSSEMSPLAHAIRHNNYNLAELLIDSASIDLNKKFKNISYLHMAVTCSDDILHAILDKGVVDVNVTDMNGETPLMYAVRGRRIDAIDTLFECENIDYLKTNNDGETLYMIAKKVKFSSMFFSPLNEITDPNDKKRYKNVIIQLLKSK